jgi:hypothetical protein
MDLVKLVRGIRNLKVFNKVNGFGDLTKFIVKNSYKNVIDLDKITDEDEDESSEVSEQELQNFKRFVNDESINKF